MTRKVWAPVALVAVSAALIVLALFGGGRGENEVEPTDSYDYDRCGALYGDLLAESQRAVNSLRDRTEELSGWAVAGEPEFRKRLADACKKLHGLKQSSGIGDDSYPPVLGLYRARNEARALERELLDEARQAELRLQPERATSPAVVVPKWTHAGRSLDRRTAAEVYLSQSGMTLESVARVADEIRELESAKKIDPDPDAPGFQSYHRGKKWLADAQAKIPPRAYPSCEQLVKLQEEAQSMVVILKDR